METYATYWFVHPLQSNSEHISLQPLRVEILHTAVMAHQTFALRLGVWFQKVTGYSGTSHAVYCISFSVYLLSFNHTTTFFPQIPFYNPLTCFFFVFVYPCVWMDVWILSVGLRQLFCQVVLQPPNNGGESSPICRLMLHDARLYKGQYTHL